VRDATAVLQAQPKDALECSVKWNRKWRWIYTASGIRISRTA